MTAPTDVDLDLKAFEDVVNSHLVGKFVNIASRCAKLLETHFSNTLSENFWSPPGQISDESENALVSLGYVEQQLRFVPDLYEACDFREVAVKITRASDHANEYIADAAPWALAKDPSRRTELHIVLTTGLNMFRMIACALRPIAPAVSEWAADFLGADIAKEFVFPKGLRLSASSQNESSTPIEHC